MSFTQVLEQIPALNFEKSQILIRRALELDDPPLSEADQSIVESRLAAHRADPASSIPLAEIKTRVRSRRKS